MTEVELKLALLVEPGAGVVHMLAHTPLLAGCPVRRQILHNIYYDTPDHQLLRQGVALRVRRIGKGARTRWLQTLKTGDGGASALSQRGEWESPLEGPQLSVAALQGTPWVEMDPQGAVFAGLQPCFSTEFTRSFWTLPWADGSVVEVALDLGRIVADQRQSPIRELEIELKAGSASSLFDVALQIARVLPVMPSSASKSERGYALAASGAPFPAAAPDPASGGAKPSPDSLAQSVLHTALRQFTAHLIAARHDDEPELVHQARVAWRRFRSARRLFKSLLNQPFPDVQAALQPLLHHLGAVRDLDVARTESLPRVAPAYIDDDPGRARGWHRMLNKLGRCSARARAGLHDALDDVATGQALIGITQWLEALATRDLPQGNTRKAQGPARAWALRTMRRQRRALRDAMQGTDNAQRLHQVRILAKRLRYGVDTLRPLLPARRARRWHQLAARLQADLGAQRDALQAALLVQQLPGHAQIAEFLRGHLAGVQRGGKRPPRA